MATTFTFVKVKDTDNYNVFVSKTSPQMPVKLRNGLEVEKPVLMANYNQILVGKSYSEGVEIMVLVDSVTFSELLQKAELWDAEMKMPPVPVTVKPKGKLRKGGK